MRRKISDDKKRKKVSFSIDPDVYELWKQYCDENEIENYSEILKIL